MIREAGLNPMSLKWPNFLVAQEGGMTIGIGQVKRHGDGSLELASLAVVPDRQGQGIGSALVRELIGRHEGKVLYLTCRSQLQDYYQRFRFRRVERAGFPPYFARLILMINTIGRLYRMQIIVMRREPDRNPSTPSPFRPS